LGSDKNNGIKARKTAKKNKCRRMKYAEEITRGQKWKYKEGTEERMRWKQYGRERFMGRKQDKDSKETTEL
jgi:hypothetical protein